MNERKVVLSLCDATTHMALPWLEAGFVCFCVDIRHPKGTTGQGGLYLVGADILDWLPPREDYAVAFAFTPCTDLAVTPRGFARAVFKANCCKAAERLDFSKEALR